MMTEAESKSEISTSRGFAGSEHTEHFSCIELKESLEEAVVQNIAGQGISNGHIVDIDRWAESLARILDDVPQYMCNPGHPARIGKIPESLREVDVKAYEPCFLSIGPYHHGCPKLEYMEKRKRIVLKCTLQHKTEITLKDYLKAIKSIEPKVRSFYTNVEMNSEKFVQMLLLDSLYIITVFCGMGESKDKIDPMKSTTASRTDNEEMIEKEQNINDGAESGDDNENIDITERVTSSQENNAGQPTWFWILLSHDLFLLENQLPFFLLQTMYDLTHGNSKTQLIATMKDAFVRLLSVYTSLDSDMVISPIEDIHHLLHLCHMFFRPTFPKESTICQLPESSQMFRLGSAVQLYEQGVKFMLRSSSTKHSLLDITFGGSGEMVMPCLYVEDNTFSLLRNLIALEQMKFPFMGLDVSAYAVLLLHLVTTPEDVKLLRRQGIIQHHLASDKEMMYLVNRLSVGLSFDYAEDEYSLKPVFQELKRYSDRKTPRWGALLKHKYFSNPWMVISLLAASLLLFLSAVQTYYAVYSYYHPFFDGMV